MHTTDTPTVDGLTVDVVRGGAGKKLLYLHSVEGPDPAAPWFEALANHFDVIAPWHPGFGKVPLPRDYRTVGDLATYYLDFIEHYRLEDAVLVGASFGGWLAAEVAIRNTKPFSHAVFIDSVGIKVGDRETRDIADIFAISQAEMTALAYHNASSRTRDYSAMTDEQRLMIARSRETYTKLSWQPYMHNPSLRHWLRRVRVPSLVIWGESDGIASPAYGQAFADALPDARFATVPDAGHYPMVEQPQQTVELIASFAAAHASATQTGASHR